MCKVQGFHAVLEELSRAIGLLRTRLRGFIWGLKLLRLYRGLEASWQHLYSGPLALLEQNN